MWYGDGSTGCIRLSAHEVAVVLLAFVVKVGRRCLDSKAGHRAVGARKHFADSTKSSFDTGLEKL
jgi:hypothetical protein